MRHAGLVIVLFLAPGLSMAQLCPFPLPACHPRHLDVNCDGRDPVHCGPFDLDGAAYGDCAPDGSPDDLWLLEDVDLDGRVDPCGGVDAVEMMPDGAVDGTLAHPLCDGCRQDVRQIENAVTFIDASTFTIRMFPGHSADLGRGNVNALTEDDVNVLLGPLACLANDTTQGSRIDPQVPLPGEAFFYVVRWSPGPVGCPVPFPYGFGRCKERIVSVGQTDCLLDTESR